MIPQILNPPSSTDPANFDARADDLYENQLPTVIDAINVATNAMNLADTTSISTSSLTIGSGANSIVVEVGKGYVSGQRVVIAYTPDPSNAIYANVEDYDPLTGDFDFDGLFPQGAGTYTDWTISLAYSQILPKSIDSPSMDDASVIARMLDLGVLPNVPMINGKFAFSAAGGAMTVALKTTAGVDPSADDPVYVIFRPTSILDSGVFVVPVTAALSATLPSGATLGAVSLEAWRIRLVMVYKSTTGVMIGFYNSLKKVSAKEYQLVGLDESENTLSTGLLSAASDSAHIVYTSSGVFNALFREVAYFDIEPSTAGTWTAGYKQVLIGQGSPKTGDIVSDISAYFSSVATGTTTIPVDNTTPTIFEGDEYMLFTAPTPSHYANAASSPNLFHIEAIGNYASSAVSLTVTQTIFDHDNAICHAATSVRTGATASKPVQVITDVLVRDRPMDDIRVRAGLESAGTLTFNGAAGAGLYGGVLSSSLKIQEIFV